jgi:hypothetical protein
MKRLYTFIFGILFSVGIFAQVELVSLDATKTYPDGKRISYLTLSAYPTDSDFLDFVNSNIIKDTRIIRFSIYKDGNRCFAETKDDYWALLPDIVTLYII